LKSGAKDIAVNSHYQRQPGNNESGTGLMLAEIDKGIYLAPLRANYIRSPETLILWSIP
jgi:hypothetical protein